MEMAFERSGFPACLWELHQEGKLGADYQAKSDPTCSPYLATKPFPLTEAIICPLFNLGKFRGQEPHRKRRNSTRTWGGGVVGGWDSWYKNKIPQSKLLPPTPITAKASLARRRHWCISHVGPGLAHIEELSWL